MKNTNAYIRYRTLDACFRNRRKKYFFEDLLDAVNRVLGDYDGSQVSERQLRQDITRMEREAINGGRVELLRLHDGHPVYYRYKDPESSLFDSYISQEEAQTLTDAIQLLSRLKGMPQFDWIEETLARLRQTFMLDGTVAGTVSFAQNPYLTGLDWFGRVFDAIVGKEVIDVEYSRFGRPVRTRRVHPYQLRQWNNRWYVIGFEERLSP